MGVTKQEVHRPGAFKQTNKVHKTGRHRSKGSISSEIKGKANVKVLSKRVKKNIGKEARRNQSSQIRKNKRDEVLAQKRNLGGAHSAPVLICVIPLHEDVDMENVLSLITKADETADVLTSPCGITHISVPRFKQRFSVIVPPVGNVFATLDAAKVATVILFVTSADQSENNIVDNWGEEIVTSCLAQGLSTAIVALTNLETVHVKKRQEFKHFVQQAISKWLPEEKILQLDSSTDALNILRRAGSQKQRSVSYRNKRPFLLAEETKFALNQDSTELGTLMVTGYLQSMPLSVNNLIHIPGLGDFQMSQIDAPTDPYPIDKNRQRKEDHRGENKMEDETLVRILEHADPKKQESLISENVPDPMDAEQTWPTEEELAQAAARQKKKIVKTVPKGTSEYQAAWIPDEDAEDLSQYSDDSDDDMSVDEAKSQVDSEQDAEDNEEYETLTVSEAAPDEQRYDQDIDMAEEKQAMEKIKEAKLDAQFPDEVDTPQDVLARDRFQKYRGLQSFRTSPWDPKENLPIDYARIFQFANFDRTRKRIFKESQEQEGALPGWYITLHVINVRREAFSNFCLLDSRPLIVFGLLPNEHKMSLLNVVLKHTNHYQLPIKSKTKLIFQCGFRRFSACPIFSQHTNGTKHKYERFFHPEGTIVASMYAPITFPPCPVLCYVEKLDGSMELIGTGSVLSVNPDRIVVKRVVLSGHPFKVNKRSAVIRFMFFNRQDINWFKPVQLRTKYGRRGHIKEPLGTHGHMKCVFNGQLKSQDTILMNLYKRVFPKWTYESFSLTQSETQEKMNME
ncbi:hypothetical protein KM043_012952 [Ampulex compressa]|nr:hypothetical protein KM043_012952 [Ampulex compressa]